MDRLIDLLPELWDATLETLYVATSGFILGGLAGLILGAIGYGGLALVALVLVSVRPLIRSWLIRQNPEEIVKWRFARGEVDEEEFEKILKRLRG